MYLKNKWKKKPRLLHSNLCNLPGKRYYPSSKSRVLNSKCEFIRFPDNPDSRHIASNEQTQIQTENFICIIVGFQVAIRKSHVGRNAIKVETKKKKEENFNYKKIILGTVMLKCNADGLR